MAKIFVSDIQSVTLNYHTPSLIHSYNKYSVSSLVVPKMEEGISGTGAVKNSK